jgi:tetratricopeptide (TPR) repeat protein
MDETELSMHAHESQRVVRKLAAAEGYLELGMATQAIQQIERVADAGPFEAIAELLRGEALQQQAKFDEAIPALNRAAELFPKPFNQRALLGLSRCYQARGDVALAEQAAEAAAAPLTANGDMPEWAVSPIFQVQSQNKRHPPAKG